MFVIFCFFAFSKKEGGKITLNLVELAQDDQRVGFYLGLLVHIASRLCHYMCPTFRTLYELSPMYKGGSQHILLEGVKLLREKFTHTFL